MKNIYSEEAFTLLEVMVALSITSLVLILLSVGVTHFKYTKDNIEVDRQLDWHLFINQMEYYMNNSEFILVTPNRLVVKEVDPRTSSTMTAEYIKVNRNFIRRVNNGTQPMLMDVKNVSFYKSSSIIKIASEFNNGEHYQARIRVNSWDEDKVE